MGDQIGPNWSINAYKTIVPKDYRTFPLENGYIVVGRECGRNGEMHCPQMKVMEGFVGGVVVGWSFSCWVFFRFLKNADFLTAFPPFLIELKQCVHSISEMNKSHYW